MSQLRRRSRLNLRRPSGILFWTALLLFFAGFVVPLIHANSFRRQIQTALEHALGRKVEIGDVTLRLLTGPGFQLHNVIIGEDPAFGIEHFAYMSAMHARLRLRTLWTGQIQLASLTLSEPSINLVKNAQGRWNFETLVNRASAVKKGPGDAPYFPYIGIDDGRVNFKFGDYKSVFHIQDVEAAVSPPRDAGGRWRLRFGGRPARTDRTLSGMGRITGEGSLSTSPARTINLEMALATSPMAYILTLTRGRDYGVHGQLGAKLRLSGELSRVLVQGALQIADVHRWDLMPSEESRLVIPFRGEADLPRQELHLESEFPRAVRVSFHLANYLSSPQWQAMVNLENAPADPVLRVAQHLGAALPAQLALQGALSGTLEFAGSPWPRGQVSFSDGLLTLPDCPPLEVGPTEVRLDGPAFGMLPAEMRLGKEVVELSASGRLDGFQMQAVFAVHGVRIDALRKHATVLRQPWLSALSEGVLDGRMMYRKERGQAGIWTGSGAVTKAQWQPEGLESPVEITQARVRWEPAGFHIEPFSGSLGDTHFAGSCFRSDGRTECKLRVRELDLAELDRWMNPKQRSSRWAVWARALGIGSSQSTAWLKTANVEGSLAVDNLRLGRWAFRNLRSGLAWSRGTLALNGLRAELGKGSVGGWLKAEFTGAVPRYSVQASARDLDLKSLSENAALPANFRRGAVDLRLGLTTTGQTADELRSAVKVSGSFEGHSLILDNLESDPAGETENNAEVRMLQGQFEWSRTGLELTKMRLAIGKEVYQGWGLIGGRPPVSLELVSGTKQVRLVSARVIEEAAIGEP